MPATPELYSFIAKWEGGLSQDGNTNKGIEWSTFQSLAPTLGLQPDRDTFNALTTAQQQQFIDLFWLRSGFSRIRDNGLADFLFDWYWGFPTASAAYTAKALNDTFGLSVNMPGDGWHTDLVDAVNSIPNQQAVLTALKAARAQMLADYIQAHPTFAQYANGWNNRLNDAYNTFAPYTGTVLDSSAPAPLQSSLLPAWMPPWAGYTIAGLLFAAFVYEVSQPDKPKRPLYYLNGNNRINKKKRK